MRHNWLPVTRQQLAVVAPGHEGGPAGVLFDIFVKIIFEDLRLQFRECDAEALSRLWTTWLEQNGAWHLSPIARALHRVRPSRGLIKASRPEDATCKGVTKEHNGGCLQSADPRKLLEPNMNNLSIKKQPQCDCDYDCYTTTTTTTQLQVQLLLRLLLATTIAISISGITRGANR